MTTLATMSLASLVALHNAAVLDYAPEGFGEVAKFASKAKAVAALEALCTAGNLAVTFDGDKAVIIDAMEGASVVGADGEGYGANDDDEGDKARMIAEGGNEGGNEGDDDGDDDAGELLGDAKGKPRAWGFVTASDAWLKANARGTEAREAYRTARRKAARMARKAERAAKEAAQTVGAE